MINSGHISVSITSFDEFRRFRAGLKTLRSRYQVSVCCPVMGKSDTICPSVSRYVHLCPHMKLRSSLWSILKNWVRIDYESLSTTKSGIHCIIWPPISPHLVYGDRVRSRIWSMNHLVHIEAEVRNLDLRYHIMADFISLLSRCQVSVNWPQNDHDDTIYPVVVRYVHLCPRLTQRRSFWSIWKNWVWFDYVCLSTPKSCRLSIIRPRMVQYGLI